jgi:type I restriction enzyme S subunit
MQINRVPISEVKTSRLDPDYYKAEYLASEKAVKKFGAFNLGDAGKLFAGPFGSKLPSKLYIDEGIPLFRISNIGNMEAIPKNMAHLAPEVHQELKTSEVGAGDLLIVKASVSEKICKVPASIAKANITQHIIALRSNGKYDTDYLMTFLFSSFGCHQLLRRSLGSIIQYLGISDTRNVSVPDVNKNVQTYIGNKVRQAELLREWAKQLSEQANAVFDNSIGWDPKTVERVKFGRISADKLENRLDHRFNSIEKIKAIDLLKQNNIKLQELEDIYSITAMVGWKGLTTEHYVDDGPWLLRGVEFSNGVIDFDSLVMVDKEKYLEQPQIHLREGDIALSKDGTIGKAIVIPKIDKEFAVGSTIARLRKIDDTLEPYYLEHCLNHDFLQVQIESYATGVAQPHITQEWIAKLLIPRIANEQQVSTLIRKHHLAMNLAKSLTNSSKKLVESLIDGQITEGKLIETQQALDDGDNSKDGVILSKLTDKGYLAEGGKPLFDDLDKLYELLDEAKVAMDVDGEHV